MTETTRSKAVTTRRVILSKVPEITVWFWIIKIFCTTVGESFADWINMTLGVGLNATALIFTAVFGVVLAWQLSLNRYVPFAYWLTVVWSASREPCTPTSSPMICTFPWH